MLKKILLKIQKLEQQKKTKVDKQSEIQKEKLEKKSQDFLNNMGGKTT